MLKGRHLWLRHIYFCLLGILISCSQRPPLPAFNDWRARNEQQVAALERHLEQEDVTHILPLDQLLRSASDWSSCAADAYQVPPSHQWDSLVAVLRLVGALRVAGILGAIEVHSGYRTRPLNACAGGAARSAHMRSFALDFTPIDDRDVTQQLCAFWLAEGKNWNMGLSRYPSGRIHIDTAGYRTWGVNQNGEPTGCRTATNKNNFAR